MNQTGVLILIILAVLFVAILAAAFLVNFIGGKSKSGGMGGSERVYDTVRVSDSGSRGRSRSDWAKTEVDDKRLLNFIYNKSIAPFGISKKAFFSDPEWSQAELQHAKERIGRLTLRLNSARDALELYFGLSNAERHSDVEQAPRFKSDEPEDLHRSAAEAAAAVRAERDRAGVSGGRGQLDDIRRIIHDKEAELARLRSELSGAITPDKDVQPGKKYPEPEAPRKEAPQAKEKAKTVLFPQKEEPAKPAAPQKSAPPPPSPAPFVLDAAAEIRALITVINAAGAVQKAVPPKITALAKKAERMRIEVEDMRKLLLSITGNAMEIYAERINKASDYWDGLLLISEYLSDKRIRMQKDAYLARVRLAEIAKERDMDFAALVKAEEQIVHAGILAAERKEGCVSITQSMEGIKAAFEQMVKSFWEKVEREKVFYSDRANYVQQFCDTNQKRFTENHPDNERETAYIRKEFMEQTRGDEEARSLFYTRFNEYVKRLPDFDYSDALKGLKAERDKATGALRFVQGAAAKREVALSIRKGMLLPDETARLADGTIIDTSGEVARPGKKLEGEKEDALYRAKMAERKARAQRQLAVLNAGKEQPEAESIAVAIARVESQFLNLV